MNTNISIFTQDKDLTLDFKVTSDALSGNYPVLNIKSGVDGLTLFPSFEQVHELQKAINKLVVEMENAANVR